MNGGTEAITIGTALARTGTTSAAPVRTPPSTCGSPPTPSSARRAPPEVKRIIGELGTRYRPAATADLVSFQGQLNLLAGDCADQDPAHLAEAAREWARESPFLPKACELLDRCRAIAARERRNALPPPATRSEPAPAPPPPPLSDDEVRAMSPAMRRIALALGEVTPERLEALEPAPEPESVGVAG